VAAAVVKAGQDNLGLLETLAAVLDLNGPLLPVRSMPVVVVAAKAAQDNLELQGLLAAALDLNGPLLPVLFMLVAAEAAVQLRVLVEVE